MPRKCRLCGKMITNDEYDTNCTPYENGFVHTSPCFEIAVKSLTKKKEEKLADKTTDKKSKKPRAELKDRMSEKDYQDKKNFYDYLRTYIPEKIPAKVYVLTQKYIDQYNFTYISMLKTLMYIREILEKDIIDDGIGLIPYYYDEAEAFYQTVDDVEVKNKEKNIDDMYKRNIVYISPKKREIKQLDITDITDIKVEL